MRPIAQVHYDQVGMTRTTRTRRPQVRKSTSHSSSPRRAALHDRSQRAKSRHLTQRTDNAQDIEAILGANDHLLEDTECSGNFQAAQSLNERRIRLIERVARLLGNSFRFGSCELRERAFGCANRVAFW